MKKILTLILLGTLFIPLHAEEETDIPPTLASARIAAYIDRLAPDEHRRNNQTVPATITVETIEPEAKTLTLNGTPCLTDLLFIKTTLTVDGLPVTFSRRWYQDSSKRKLPLDTPENTSFTCTLTLDQLETMADGISYMDPRDVDEILDDLRPAPTPQPEPDLAARLRKEYAARHPEARALPRDGDIQLEQIVRPDYDVTLILQDEEAVAMFTSKAGDTIELIHNNRYLELIPLPQQNYFIVADHPDGHVANLLLYKVGAIWDHTPGLLSCIFQTPGEYGVKYSLVHWDWKGGVMTVRRTEHINSVGEDTTDFVVPIR